MILARRSRRLLQIKRTICCREDKRFAPASDQAVDPLARDIQHPVRIFALVVIVGALHLNASLDAHFRQQLFQHLTANDGVFIQLVIGQGLDRRA